MGDFTNTLLGENGSQIQLVMSNADLKNYLKAVLNQALDERKEENTGQVKENDKAEIYLSADDAAERLGISKTTLWHWSKDNKKITPIHVGRKVRYRLSDVERIIKGEVFA